MFRRFQVNPFDLLGQNEIYPYPVYLPGTGLPNFTIAWNSFHQNFLSELGAFLRFTRVPKGEPLYNIFKDCRIRRRIPYAALLAAALWHVVFFVIPWPKLPVGPKHVAAFDNTELTWSGPVEDLPLLNVPKEAHKADASKPATPDNAPAENTDAFHPRQRIFTDPAHPNHPTQTLVNSAAPMDAPKFLTPLPNMVQLAAPSGPARPRLEISEQTLAKLRPKEIKKVATTITPAPDIPNNETRPADMSFAQMPDAPARPQLEINAGSAPRVAARSQKGEVVTEPEVAAGLASVGGPSSTIIALSANPAPPTPTVEVPNGNLAARVSISPEGKPNSTGAPGNSSGTAGAGGPASSGSGSSPVGITISGGNPKPNAGVSGLGNFGKLTLPKTNSVYKRPDPNDHIDDPPERTGPPNFDSLPPGVPAEQIFGSHHIYSMNVDMANLNSVTGSWIIHFSEMHVPGVSRGSGQLSAPEPLRKIDPKYPQDLIQEHVEGEVVLYGIIRPDGSVDSIQVVRKLDKQLDANAVDAFSRWKFHAATKEGQPVAVEAIVHIPFRGPTEQ